MGYGLSLDLRRRISDAVTRNAALPVIVPCGNVVFLRDTGVVSAFLPLGVLSEVQGDPSDDCPIGDVGTGGWLIPEFPEAVVLELELVVEEVPPLQTDNPAPVRKGRGHIDRHDAATTKIAFADVSWKSAAFLNDVRGAGCWCVRLDHGLPPGRLCRTVTEGYG